MAIEKAATLPVVATHFRWRNCPSLFLNLRRIVGPQPSFFSSLLGNWPRIFAFPNEGKGGFDFLKLKSIGSGEKHSAFEVSLHFEAIVLARS
jgi:hypothetical protein